MSACVHTGSYDHKQDLVFAERATLVLLSVGANKKKKKKKNGAISRSLGLNIVVPQCKIGTREGVFRKCPPTRTALELLKRMNYLMVGWSRACCKLDRESEEIHHGDMEQ